MEKQLFHYVGRARSLTGKMIPGDIAVVTMSTMPETYIRAIHWMSDYAYSSGYVETMNNPLYLFRVKSLKPKINNNDHIPGF